MDEPIDILNKLYNQLLLELNVGGYLWEYAIMKGYITENSDGTQKQDEIEYLLSFNVVYQIDYNSVKFTNDREDIIIVPWCYIFDLEWRTKFIRDHKAKVDKHKSNLELMDSARIKKESALSKITKLAQKHEIKLSLL